MPDLPAVQDDEPVQIINPTSVMVATAGASRNGASVMLHWTTATELEVVGFNVIRLVNGDATQLNGELIVAEYTGQAVSGSYSLVDSSPSMGELNIYRLEILMANGHVEEHALGVMNMAAGQIYLPMIR